MHEEDLVLSWFYKHEKTRKLSGTTLRPWFYLYDLMGTAHANRFYELSTQTLVDELELSSKSLDRSRQALQEAGFLQFEVRGKSIYYMLLLPETLIQQDVQHTAETAQNKETIPPEARNAHSFWWDGYEITARRESSQTNISALLQQLEAQLQEYAVVIEQLQAQLAEQQHQETSQQCEQYLEEHTEDYAAVNSQDITQTDTDNTLQEGMVRSDRIHGPRENHREAENKQHGHLAWPLQLYQTAHGK